MMWILKNWQKKMMGADIEAVCREAAMVALRNSCNAIIVKMDDFILALELVNASVDTDTKKAYEQIQNYFSSARAKEIKKEKVSYFG
jgi:transitional endoplasmic reticulum ATPase